MDINKFAANHALMIQKVVMIVAILGIMLSMLPSGTVLSGAYAVNPQPLPPSEIAGQLGAVSNQLASSTMLLQNVQDLVGKDPGPNGDQAILGELGAVSNQLGTAQHQLNDIAVKLEKDPGPISLPAVQTTLSMILSQSNGIISTAEQIENAPGSANDPAVMAALTGIINEALSINDIVQIFLGGTIIIEKDTVGGDGTFNFVTNSTAYPSFSITTVGGVGTTTLNLPILSGFVIKEVGGTSNFAFTSVSCSNIQGSNIFFLFPSDQAVTVQLVSPGNVVKCTFVDST